MATEDLTAIKRAESSIAAHTAPAKRVSIKDRLGYGFDRRTMSDNSPVGGVRKQIVTLVKQSVAIALVAYTIITLLVYAIPHLPLANRRTFYPLLKAQMTVDRANAPRVIGAAQKGIVLFLGSSVVERGVAETYMDSLFAAHGETGLETANSGTGGFFAKANLPMFRALLEHGLRPERVVYGFFLQELNGRSVVHMNVSDEDTASLKLRDKTLLNVLRYGAAALAPLTNGDGLHKYVFVANNAFREVHDLTLLDKLMFGVNMFERDSSYSLDTTIAHDLWEIAVLCKSYKIPFALYNAPVRPTITSLADLPYLHRSENYSAVFAIAKEMNTPIWNFDRPGMFEDREFQDTYHLSPEGARKITGMLESHILNWKHGTTEQDPVSSLF